MAEDSDYKKITNPVTGEVRKVDLSDYNLSKILKNIRNAAEAINDPKSPHDKIVRAFDYIENAIVDTAQYSSKLNNLTLKIMNKPVEPVRNLESFLNLKRNYIRNTYITKANQLIDQFHKNTNEAIVNLSEALEIICKAINRVKNDEMLIAYKKLIEDNIETLKDEVVIIDKIRQKEKTSSPYYY